MSYPYADHNEAAIGVLPGIAARDEAGTYFVEITRQLSLLDEDVARIYEGLTDLELATEGVLDIAGDLVNEDRGGLGDFEFRRLIAGRRVARAGAITAPRVWAGWMALTLASSGRLYELPPASVYLTADVTWIPSSTWLIRAGAVVRDLLAAGVQGNAVVVPPRSARYNSAGLPYGVGAYAYTLSVMGA